MIKGEIWWADLPKNFYGSEPGKRRPVLVIQNDIINRSTIKTVICALITTNVNQAKVPGNILLEKSNSGLEKQSVVNFSQIFTMQKQVGKNESDNSALYARFVLRLLQERK